MPISALLIICLLNLSVYCCRRCSSRLIKRSTHVPSLSIYLLYVDGQLHFPKRGQCLWTSAMPFSSLDLNGSDGKVVWLYLYGKLETISSQGTWTDYNQLLVDSTEFTRIPNPLSNPSKMFRPQPEQPLIAAPLFSCLLSLRQWGTFGSSLYNSRVEGQPIWLVAAFINKPDLTDLKFTICDSTPWANFKTDWKHWFINYNDGAQ